MKIIKNIDIVYCVVLHLYHRLYLINKLKFLGEILLFI